MADRAPPFASAWIEQLSGGRRMDSHLDLAFPGCDVAVSSNDSRLIERLTFYFKDFVSKRSGGLGIRITAVEAPELRPAVELQDKAPDPGKERVKEQYADLGDGRMVRKKLTGMLFVFTREHHLAYGPCLANDNQVVNYINSRYIQWYLDRGHLLAHAAAVAENGRGIAIAGFSGMGKSTLALLVMNRGTTFVSNDRLLIRREDGALFMKGVAKLSRVNPGTVLNNPSLGSVMPDDERQRVEQLPATELWNLEQKYDVFIDRCFGPGKFDLGARMIALVLLNWRREEVPLEICRTDLSQRLDLLLAFMKDGGLFYLAPVGAPVDFSPQAYLQALAGCPVFELCGGVDFESAAGFCLKLVRAPDSAAVDRATVEWNAGQL